jgi:membrane associated rhomboid family serine protease
MLALRFVGGAIEMSHGWFAAFLIFTLSAVGGTVLSAIFLPDAISVGASGGIFGALLVVSAIQHVQKISLHISSKQHYPLLGFIGACLADIMMNWSLLFSGFVTENGKKHRHATVVIVLVLDIVLNCIIGLTPYVDNFSRKCSAHSNLFH